MPFPAGCYICRRTGYVAHEFYRDLCQPCGEANYSKRMSHANLAGYTAVVTGGRIKIGFETALRLLRSGARVIVTTRFTSDCRRRFDRQPDRDAWESRLSIRAVDFRVTSAVEHLCRSLTSEFGRIDILINNAAQTLRRPPAFYAPLLKGQAVELGQPESGRGSLGSFPLAAPVERAMAALKYDDAEAVARLSQLALIPGDEVLDSPFFPQGSLDKDGQQEDRRPSNSWMLSLGDVHIIEFLEVLYINVVAPFVLCSQLRASMRKQSTERPSFIVNVTAMEGNFHDPEKNARHPHTNMAKAALNMMTRTCAPDFADDRIFMNAVDTGWITNEKPFALGSSPAERRVQMAIDEVDGAARICDPIFSAVAQGQYVFGSLFKNYSVYPW